jgi:hypothetical protein
MDRALGDQVQCIDPDGQRVDLPLDPDDFAHLFTDLPQDATARLFTMLASRLRPTLVRIQRTLEGRDAT